MICPNCKNHVEEKYSFCPKCGEKLKPVKNNYKDHDNQYNYSEIYSNISQKKVTSEEDYLKAYMGNSYNYIKQEKFSVIAFIFGPLYLLYKKLWSYSLLLLLVIIAIALEDLNIAATCTIIINLYLGFKFNSMYLELVNRKVEEIKISNPDKSSTELLQVCQKKGNNNNIFIILLIIFLLIGIISVYYSFQNNESTEEKQFNNLREYFNKINYVVPNGFEAKNYNNNYYRYYSLIDKDNYCSITISYYGNEKEPKEFLKTYRHMNEENNLGFSSEIKNKKINSTEWYYYTKQTDYLKETVYVTLKENIYLIKFANDNKSDCQDSYNDFLSSIKFKN